MKNLSFFLLATSYSYSQKIDLVNNFYSANFDTEGLVLSEHLSDYKIAESKSVFSEVKGLNSVVIDLKAFGFKDLDEELEFKEINLFAENYQGDRKLIEESSLFQSNKNGYEACLSIFKGEYIHLRIKRDREEFFVVSDAFLVGQKDEQGVLVIYKKSDIKDKENALCGLSDEVVQSVKSQAARQINSYNLCRKVTVSYEADNEWTNHWGSGLDGYYITAIMNNVNSYFYSQLNISVAVNGGIYSGGTPDPYSSTTNGQTLVTEFRNYWNANYSGISRDAAILFSYRTLYGTRDDGTVTTIGGKIYSGSSSKFCNVGNAYAVIGANGPSFYSYYYWITAHEMGHLAGATHDDASSNVMTSTLILNSNFSMSSKNQIWNYLYSGPDKTCLITGDIRMKLTWGDYIDPYSLNNVCTYGSSNLTAVGNHSISWSFYSNSSGAYYTSTNATSANVYRGGSPGAFTVKATKSNSCGSIDRYYPFLVNDCYAYSYYPNEVSSYLNVEFSGVDHDYLPDEIYIVDDRNMRLIQKKPKEEISANEDDSPVQGLFQLDLSELRDGVYYLKLYFANREKNQTDTHRILKIK